MSHTQSLLFPRAKEYSPIKYHVTDNYVRARLTTPDSSRYIYRSTNTRGIKAIEATPRGSRVQRMARNGGSLHFPTRGQERRLTRIRGGAIGSDLGIGAATVGTILAGILAKKIYDKVKGN